MTTVMFYYVIKLVLSVNALQRLYAVVRTFMQFQ